jgi:hypothetical protein
MATSASVPPILSQKLDIAGNINVMVLVSSIIKITGGSPGSGKILTSDATGVVHGRQLLLWD